MKKLLFVAIEFAPINTTGNYRSLKFVKYLRDFNIDTTVVTLTVDSALSTFGNNLDEKLLDEVPKEVEIIRFPLKTIPKFILSNKFLNYLRIYFRVDDGISKRWLSNGLERKIDLLVKEKKPDIMYITLPPFSTYRIGKLAKKYKLPLIVDMRDAWSNWCISPWQTRLHHYLAYKKEKEILTNASIIVTTTKQIAKQFLATHKELNKDSIKVITNGYDYSKEINSVIRVGDLSNKKCIKIGYIGSFYYNRKAHDDKSKKWWQRSPRKLLQYTPVDEDWSYRTPLYFFMTLHQVFKMNPELKSRVIFELIGNIPDWFHEMVTKYELKNNVITHGFLSSEKVKYVSNDFDFFLATSEKMIGGEQVFLPSKLFDYISLEKPILGFVTEGVQKEFLEKSGAGIIFDPDKLYDSAEKLKKVLEGNVNLSLSKNYLNSYSRKNITKQLAEIIHSLT